MKQKPPDRFAAEQSNQKNEDAVSRGDDQPQPNYVGVVAVIVKDNPEYDESRANRQSRRSQKKPKEAKHFEEEALSGDETPSLGHEKQKNSEGDSDQNGENNPKGPKDLFPLPSDESIGLQTNANDLDQSEDLASCEDLLSASSK